VVRAGVLEPLERITRRELAARGVPAEVIEVLGPPLRTDRQEIHRVSAWLENSPGACIALPFRRFSSARQRHVLNQIMGFGTAWRKHLSDKQYSVMSFAEVLSASFSAMKMFWRSRSIVNMPEEDPARDPGS